MTIQALRYGQRRTTYAREQIDYELVKIEKEIAWNERRLVNLVWDEDDRKQTEDYIANLRQERQRLLAVLTTGGEKHDGH